MKTLLPVLATAFLACAVQAQVAPTEANLRAAAASGGVTKFSAAGTISLATPVTITADTTLDADGHAVTIDGGNVTRLFEVSGSGKLTLKGFLLANGRAKGADSTTDGGGPAGSAQGGAIQNLGGQVTVISCTFSNNSARGGSGVVTFMGARPWQYNNGGLAFGGAIYQTSGSLTIQGGAFLANSAGAGFGSGPAPAYGGAICSLNGNVVITDTTFATNTLGAGGNFGIHGNAEAYGGAIYIENGSLDAQRVRLLGNFANGFANAPCYGGAIAAKSGTLSIVDSLFSGNKALGGVGAFYTSGLAVPGLPGYGGALNVGSNATATVRSSTFASNTTEGGRDSSIHVTPAYAAAFGGAIAVQGNLAAINCTLVENVAFRHNPQSPEVADGGALYNTGTSALTNVTAASNSAAQAILSSPSGSLTLKNTLLAERSGVNVASGFTDAGYNLSATASPTFSHPSSHNNVDLKLGPLGDYGGPTPTIPLMLGSAAIDAADDSAAPATDQRGRSRPHGAHADVGAFESSPPFYIFGSLHGYLNTSTTATFGSTSVQPDANGSFAFTVPAGANTFSFSGTNSVFRPNPLVFDATADMEIEARAFELNALTFDPDLASPSFTLAGKAGETWEIHLSNDLVNWTVADTHTFATDGVVSVSIPNTGEPTFAKAIRK
jgi:hypothetical protein